MKETLARELLLQDEGATQSLARRIGEHCQGGEIILLEGPLGAGKTCFAGGLAQGLGIAGPIPSPTFVLLRSYQGRATQSRVLTLHHFDFYRLNAPSPGAAEQFDDCLSPDSIILVEWASRLPHLFADFTLRIELLPQAAENERLARFEIGTLAASHLQLSGWL